MNDEQYSEYHLSEAMQMAMAKAVASGYLNVEGVYAHNQVSPIDKIMIEQAQMALFIDLCANIYYQERPIESMQSSVHLNDKQRIDKPLELTNILAKRYLNAGIVSGQKAAQELAKIYRNNCAKYLGQQLH